MIESKELFNDISDLLEGIGLRLVELVASGHKRSVSVRSVVYRPGGTGIEECARAHKLMQPRLAELLGEEDFHLEVASPGIDRTFRDAREYGIFVDRGVLLVLEDGDQVGGVIASYDGATVALDRSGERIAIPVGTIRKGKLDFSQEGR
ncbi:MAG: hypothetical protein E4H20_01095 [Spirochaetales bacterium]|nr:MAG: hypothetical protein E4H20_01095 [Spirochaetales bacterium]